jgi:hypothetical protein
MMTRLLTKPVLRSWMLALTGGLLLSASQPLGAGQDKAPAAPEAGWESLFDGKVLGHWEPTKFFKPGAVTVTDGQIILETGSDLTGNTWNGPELPATNYELALQAMRVEGSDFFAAVTFPVENAYCSLILGGWGGTMVGLSSVDGMDASENETSQTIDFNQKQWYGIRIRVTPVAIQVWLDDRQIITQELKNRRIDTRIEVDASRPLGVASWRTKSAIREIRLRRLQ